MNFGVKYAGFLFDLGTESFQCFWSTNCIDIQNLENIRYNTLLTIKIKVNQTTGNKIKLHLARISNILGVDLSR